MNTTIETILNHRSIREFKDTKLTDEQIHTIISAAQQASTSSYMMAYTIIGITDPAKKAALAEVSGHPHVTQNGHLLIFCADLKRPIQQATNKQYQQMLPNLENSEHFLVSAIDAALAAQNAAIAAESMGLGMCYLGSIRNNLARTDEILGLPQHVIPLFGMALGVPDHQPEKKPRLPQSAIYFENEYPSFESDVEQFDEEIADYYQSRSTNNRKDTWSEQMIRRFSEPMRMDVTDLVQKKGFNKR
ncbi:oxygen-insensitive NADPH nitroreductase [Halobacillus shinanisalinarum]|uniref:Oxygen-insensitive NADPH nitroreductase n=1 Tax=Halobacillus shinanisalinarum TaxID=2932258 RepID=A0ABY4GZ64_9BACI|nr:oxygen-insensitive NADPH nitroreductase [Halobacillus shinanisalinarum]UOQ92960.1 oxygen-insensitive NADPH nitroreductase [Halobacillus shinanisalinarum]